MAKKFGTCACEFAGLRQDCTSGAMEMVFKVCPDDRNKARGIADQVGEAKLNLTIDKYAEKRSLDANAYFWLLVGRLASVLGVKSEDIYREYIQEIGDNFEVVPLSNEAKDKWMQNWASNGIGWVCRDMGSSKIEGYSNILCYYGSSTYDSHQMSRLIDLVVFDCKDQGIETLPPERLEAMRIEWSKKQESKGV